MDYDRKRLATALRNEGVGGVGVLQAAVSIEPRTCGGVEEFGVGFSPFESAKPLAVPGITINGGSVGAGDGITCAWGGGADVVRCWGTTPPDSYSPKVIPGLDVGGTVAQLSVGGRYACVLLTDRTVRCWGFNNSGELGNGTPDSAGIVTVGGLGPVAAIPFSPIL